MLDKNHKISFHFALKYRICYILILNKVFYQLCSIADNQELSDSQNSLEERNMHSFLNFLKLVFNCFKVGKGEPISIEIVFPVSKLVWHFVIESVIKTGCSCMVKSVSFLKIQKNIYIIKKPHTKTVQDFLQIRDCSLTIEKGHYTN